VSIVELTGLPEDPDCLHCFLARQLDEFSKTHPNRSGPETIGGLAQLLGEIMGSAVYNDGKGPECIPMIASGALRITIDSALQILATLRRKPQ